MTMEFEQQAKFTRELPVELNEHELQVYGRMLAEKVREEKLTEEKKKQVTKEWNTKIGVIRNDITRIAEARAKGAELRPVTCAERLHGNVIEIVRLDTQEVVDTRPADLRDLQTTLPGTDGPPSGGYVDNVVPFEVLDGGMSTEPSGFGGDEQISTGETSGVSGTGTFGASADHGTGAVIDADGEKVGEVVASSVGDAVYVSDQSDENQDCPACSEPITDSQETVVDEGMLVHTGCAAEVAAESNPDLPPPTFSATIGENVDAKKPGKKRDRSKKSNEAKKPGKK